MFNSVDKRQGNHLSEFDYGYEASSPTSQTNEQSYYTNTNTTTNNNNNNNNGSDDEGGDDTVDMTFSQLYEMMKQQPVENIPANILQTLSKKDLVLCELRREGMNPQFKRDAEYWYNTLSVFTHQSNQDVIMSDFSLASNITEKFELIALEKKRIDILRRMFIVLRYGDLLYRKSKKTNDWMPWSELKGLPIATAMSHGSRIIIQLPKSAMAAEKKGIFSKLKNTLRPKDESSHDHGFWTWLLCGDENGSLEMVVTPETTNGSVSFNISINNLIIIM